MMEGRALWDQYMTWVHLRQSSPYPLVKLSFIQCKTGGVVTSSICSNVCPAAHALGAVRLVGEH